MSLATVDVLNTYNNINAKLNSVLDKFPHLLDCLDKLGARLDRITKTCTRIESFVNHTPEPIHVHFHQDGSRIQEQEEGGGSAISASEGGHSCEEVQEDTVQQYSNTCGKYFG